MPVSNFNVSALTKGAHTFSVHEPIIVADWLVELADEYVALRTACAAPIVQPVQVDGIGVLDTTAIAKRLAKACVPSPDLARKNFSVTRSDLSEVAAYLTLEQFHQTRLGFKLVRDRELIQLPGRGIDAIGVEPGGKLVLVLTEVKFSDENSMPKAPQVVDKASDGFRSAHLAHLKDRENTVRKLFDCARRCSDGAVRDHHIAAALYFEQQKWDHLSVVACNVLVRPKSRHSSPGDFGSFHAKPADFAPAHVRFVVISVPTDLDSLLKDWAEAVERRRVAA